MLQEVVRGEEEAGCEGGLEDGGWQLQAANKQVEIFLIIITTIGQVKRK